MIHVVCLIPHKCVPKPKLIHLYISFTRDCSFPKLHRCVFFIQRRVMSFSKTVNFYFYAFSSLSNTTTNPKKLILHGPKSYHTLVLHNIEKNYDLISSMIRWLCINSINSISCMSIYDELFTICIYNPKDIRIT